MLTEQFLKNISLIHVICIGKNGIIICKKIKSKNAPIVIKIRVLNILSTAE